MHSPFSPGSRKSTSGNRKDKYLKNPKNWAMAQKSPKRKSLSELEFPKNSSPEEKIKHVLEYAVLAPSTLNTQPWKFKIEGSRVSFLGDFSKEMKAVDPERRQIHFSLGAVVGNFLVALDKFGLSAKAEFPEEGFAAAIVTVGFPETHNGEEHAEVSGGMFPPEMFHSIERRATSHAIFKREEIPEEVLMHLAGAIVGGEGILLSLITGEMPKAKAGEIVRNSQVKFGESKDYRKETSALIRHSYSAHLDGKVFGFSGPLSLLNSRLARTHSFWKREGDRLEKHFSQAPLICVLSTEKDLRQSWIRAGIAFELFSLTATALGYEIEGTFAPIEDKERRGELKALIEQEGFPQIVMRVGTGEKLTEKTPRKPVEEFLRD